MNATGENTAISQIVCERDEAGNAKGAALVFKTRQKVADGGSIFEHLRIDSSGNIGFNQASFGTGAAEVLALGSGTAPSSSPADAVQLWAADRGGVAGKAALHIRTEDGAAHVIGDRVGFGTASPAYGLDVVTNAFQVQGEGTYCPNVIFRGYDNSVFPPYLLYGKARGTLSSPSDVIDGDYIGIFAGQGYYSGWRTGAYFGFVVDGTPSGIHVPMKIAFATDNGTSTDDRMTIRASGYTGFGTKNPQEKLHCNAKIRADTAFNINGTDGWSGWFDDGANFRLTVIGGIITAVANSTAGGHNP